MNIVERTRVHHEQTSSAPKKTVLLIDDSEDQTAITRHILEMDDFEVISSPSGKDALSVLESIKNPDLILLDMLLGDMSGTDFLLMLEKRNPDTLKKVPVVFLTAMDRVPMGKAAGFIRKPFDLDKFLATIHHYIEQGVSPHSRELNT